MNKFSLIVTTLILTLLFVSCEKDDIKPGEELPVTTGVYVLNEGTFNGNNTTLTYYDFSTKTATTDFYSRVNGSELGDTGNDMITYGSKLYIVMNVSSYLEVADASSGKNITKIDLKAQSGQPLSPRNIIAYKEHVFVSCWDGSVAIIDTATLAIEKFVRVGANPEQMVVTGSKLYVANSGGITPGFDSTISVIDLTTLTETGKITVAINPVTLTTDHDKNLFVGYAGDYAGVKPGIARVNLQNNTVEKKADTAVGTIVFHEGKLFATGGYFGSANVRVLNPSDFSARSANFITDGTQVALPYALQIDPLNGDVYIGDAVSYTGAPGKVFCFDENGKKKFSFSVAPGINPNSVAFVSH